MHRSLATLVPVVLLCSTAAAQVHPDELLATGLDGGYHMRSDGEVVEHYDHGLNSFGVAVLPNGLWAFAARFAELRVYDPVTDTVVTDMFLQNMKNAVDIEAFSDGTLVVVDTGPPAGLRHYDQAGNYLEFWGVAPLTTPTFLHIDAADEIWVSDHASPRVLHLDSEGSFLGIFTPPEVLDDIVTAADGTLWTVAGRNFAGGTGSGTVYHFSRTGSLLGSFPTPNTLAYSIAMTRDGTLWIANFGGSQKVRHYDQSGAFLGEFTAPGLVGNLTTTRQDGVVSTFCDESQNPNNVADIAIDGLDLVAGRSVVLSSGPPDQFCYLLIGNDTGVTSQPPGSKGDLCVTGGSCLGRYAKDIGQIDGAGNFATDISSSASGGPNFGIPTCGGSIEPGETWAFQYWHRQPMGQPSSFSSAIWVTFEM